MRMAKHKRIACGLAYSVALPCGFAGGLITHAGKQFARTVFSKQLYANIPTTPEVISDIETDGVCLSAFIVDRGFKLGLFQSVGLAVVPSKLQKLPYFRAGQYVAEYAEATVTETVLFEEPPMDLPIYHPAHMPPYTVVGVLEAILCGDLVWDFYYGICRLPSEVGLPLEHL